MKSEKVNPQMSEMRHDSTWLETKGCDMIKAATKWTF